jgi:hypothetical protein
MTENLVVILTAFNLGYDAVRRKLVDPQVHRHEMGTRFEIGPCRARSAEWRSDSPAGAIIPRRFWPSERYSSSRRLAVLLVAWPVRCGTPRRWVTS